MKVLSILFNQTWSPHFETDLELMYKHMQQGDDVHVLTNDRVLPSTISNQMGLRTTFLKERARTSAALKRIQLPQQNIHFVGIYKSSSEPFFPNNFDDLKHYSRDGVNLGLGVLSNIISSVGDYRFDVHKHKWLISQCLQTSIMVYESFRQLFSTLKPDKVILFNGRYAEYRPLVELCKKYGVSFYTHERGATFKRYMLRENRLPHDIDAQQKEVKQLWQLYADQDRELIAHKWFANQRNSVATNWLSFTAEQTKKKLPKGFDITKRNIIIFNSSLDEYESIPECKADLYDTETDIFTKIFEHFSADDTVHFYLRIHPHLKKKGSLQLKELQQLRHLKNVTLIDPNDDVCSYALLDVADTVVVTTSTIGVEACYSGKPVVLLGKSYYQELDCAYQPKSIDEVFALLTEENLVPKPKEGALMYGLWASVHGYEFTHFAPQDFFNGTFLGKKCDYQFGLKDKLLFRLYARFDNKKITSLQGAL